MKFVREGHFVAPFRARIAERVRGSHFLPAAKHQLGGGYTEQLEGKAIGSVGDGGGGEGSETSG